MAACCAMLVACSGFNVHAAQSQQPTIELLEFLAEFETDDGRWLDPLEFLDEEEDDSARGDQDSNEESHTDD
jgi:hypothetical protein